jgi:hypothetical protein
LVEPVDVTELRLRCPGGAVAPKAALAHVRDLFDEGRRLAGPSEPVPWRPLD